ncbi:MAG: methyltransferase domain-containing protein [Candidatus Aminicenantes bacterium]|nr:methyltransferase domain-containing protein [Candidatus Aminicenantes bacterium]
MFWWRQWLHRLRFLFKRWSAEKDREFHDQVFHSSVSQPFRFSYTGYITIRRFADLASPTVQKSRNVLDIGCGTGEITCELASRFPDVSFTGVDHSSSGIEKARSHARSLKLDNIIFQEGSAETFTPSREVDLVMMLDAFHHLEYPRRFVKRMGEHSSHFLLIEPRGDWKGSWDKTLDLDWMILELDKIRSRISYLLQDTEQPPVSSPNQDSSGDPVENRYSLKDFKNIFKGYGLDLRGTISGLDVYPPESSDTGSIRELFGEWAYQLYKAMDDYLYQHDQDFWAKHWVITAQKGVPHRIRKPSMKPKDIDISASKIQGPYQVEYLAYDKAHKTVSASGDFQLQVTVRNTGFLIWSSDDPKRPVFISYHWKDRSGNTVISDGERTSFSKGVSPGEKTSVTLFVRAPDKPGRYILAVDLVCEGVTWFSQTGSPCLSIPIGVQKS